MKDGNLRFAARNPDYLPRRFDLDAMQEDVDLFMALHPIWVSGKGEIDGSLNEMGRRFRKSRKGQLDVDSGSNSN